MTPLLQLLITELEKPRTLPPQIAKHLAGTYGVSRDAVSAFLTNELPGLEDYEIDLVLSPAFTPTLADQAIVAEHLGQKSVPESEWPELIGTLVTRPTRAVLLGEDEAPIVIALHEVTVDRYVRRLRLQGTIPDPIFSRIVSLARGTELHARTTSTAAEPALLKAIARRVVWNTAARQEILTRFLDRAVEETRATDATSLLGLIETYQPLDRAELLRRLPHWQEVLRHEIGADSGPKPFFNERVQELHGGGRDQRRAEEPRAQNRRRELESLVRLEAVLAD